MEKPCGADPQQDSSPRRCHGKRRDGVEIASSEPLNTRLQGRQGNTSHRRLEGPWKSLVEQGGAWFRNTGSPAGFKPKAVPRQAKRWCRNIIFGTATYKTRRQTTQHKPQKTYRRLEGPWKSPVEHGGAWCRNTGSPAGFKPKAVPRQAKRWSRNSIFGTAKYTKFQADKATQTTEDIEAGRPMEKPCGARWGMVPKHRIPSRIQAQGGATASEEMVSK